MSKPQVRPDKLNNVPSYVIDVLMGQIEYHFARGNLGAAVQAVKDKYKDLREEWKKPSEVIFDHINTDVLEEYLGIYMLEHCTKYTYDEILACPDFGIRKMVKLTKAMDQFGYSFRSL